MSQHAPVRAMMDSEIDAVAALWHRAGVAAYPYLPGWQALSLTTAVEVFREHIAAHCDIFVVESGGRIAGFLALKGSYIDRLYIDPAHQGRGLGTALTRYAQRLSPAGLELHTHVQNDRARALYERLGFRAAGFGISAAPESAPDVEYRWRP
jgi:ribosomal protein S18 acetylase RimI-like enzyme